ncbi:hypothetical protein HK099_002774 [Clydaea vesicula]|uniref:Uncharacterized protein n=1 Tax=Clydaea vesicula TaxID=447962 RepID=A0AAD5XWJ9_9FUNG|nr:hypothetical protein HK099_002774 [Clydaea vesicula]
MSTSSNIFTMEQATELATKHYEGYRKYLQNHVSSSTSARRAAQMEKMTRMSNQELIVMSINVFDEMNRRVRTPQLLKLPPREDLSQKKNEERESLSVIHEKGFMQLTSDIKAQLEHRFPAVIQKFNVKYGIADDSQSKYTTRQSTPISVQNSARQSVSVNDKYRQSQIRANSNPISPPGSPMSPRRNVLNANENRGRSSTPINENYYPVEDTSLVPSQRGTSFSGRNRSTDRDRYIPQSPKTLNSRITTSASSNQMKQDFQDAQQNETFDKQKNEYEQMIDELKEKVNYLQLNNDKIIGLEDKILQQLREKQELNLIIDRLTQENDNFNDEIQNQMVLENDLRNEINSLVDELNSISNLNEELHGENSKLSNLNDELTKKNTTLNKLNQELTLEINQISKLNQELKTKLSKVSSDAVDSSKSLEREEKEEVDEGALSPAVSEKNRKASLALPSFQETAKDKIDEYFTSMNNFLNVLNTGSNKAILLPMKPVMIACRELLLASENFEKQYNVNSTEVNSAKESLSFSLGELVNQAKSYATSESPDKISVEVNATKLNSSVSNLSAAHGKQELNLSSNDHDGKNSEDNTEGTDDKTTEGKVNIIVREPQVIISDQKISEYNKVIASLLNLARSDNNKSVVVAVKQVMITCRQITQDLEGGNFVDSEDVNSLKGIFSLKLANLVEACKKHATTNESQLPVIEEITLGLNDTILKLAAFANGTEYHPNSSSEKMDSNVVIISDESVDLYQKGITKLLSLADENSKNVLVVMKEIMLACRSITEESHHFEQTLPTENEEIKLCKDKFSEALSVLAVSAKNHATSTNSPVALLKDACDSLTLSVKDFARVVNSVANLPENLIAVSSTVINQSTLGSYQAALRKLIHCTTLENRKNVLVAMKDVIIICRTITQEAENLTSDDEELSISKTNFSNSLANLVAILKVHATSQEEVKTKEIEEATENLTKAVFQLAHVLNGGKSNFYYEPVKRIVSMQVNNQNLVKDGNLDQNNELQHEEKDLPKQTFELVITQERVDNYQSSLLHLLKTARGSENKEVLNAAKRLMNSCKDMLLDCENYENSKDVEELDLTDLKERFSHALSTLVSAVKTHTVLSTPMNVLEAHASALTTSVFDLVDYLNYQGDYEEGDATFEGEAANSNLEGLEASAGQSLTIEQLAAHLSTHIDLVVQAVQTLLTVVRRNQSFEDPSELKDSVIGITSIVEDISQVTRQTLLNNVTSELKVKGEQILVDLSETSLTLIKLGTIDQVPQEDVKRLKQELATLSYDILKLVKALLNLIE